MKKENSPLDYPLIFPGILVVETQSFQQARFVQFLPGGVVILQAHDGSFFSCVLSELQVWSQDWQIAHDKKEADFKRAEEEAAQSMLRGSVRHPYPPYPGR